MQNQLELDAKNPIYQSSVLKTKISEYVILFFPVSQIYCYFLLYPSMYFPFQTH